MSTFSENVFRWFLDRWFVMKGLRWRQGDFHGEVAVLGGIGKRERGRRSGRGEE